MRFLTLGEVLALQRRILAETGGAGGIHELGAISSATAQPRVSIGGVDAYPTLIDKAAALGYALACNHGFIDGNKRTAHAAMEAFLMLNGVEIRASVDEQEQVMLSLAGGELSRAAFTEWLGFVAVPLEPRK